MTSIIRIGKSLCYSLICLAVLITLACGVSLAATAPATAWENNYGTSDYVEKALSVWQTSDGGFIVSGWTDSKGTNTGGTRTTLVKTDWQGNVLWTKYYDDGGDGKCVRQTSDGGYIVVGSQGGSLLVLKTDENGAKQWVQIYPRPNGNTITGESIRQTSDGGYIVAGSINLPAPHGMDMYVAKIDSTGNKQWEKSYGGVDGATGNGVDNCYSIWPTSDGGYILGGSSWSWDYWPKAALVKLDANGNEEWFKVYNKTDARMDGSLVEVQQTRDGGYIWAGYKGKTCLLKADSNGNEQWNKTYDGYQASSVQQTWDDGYVFTDDRSGLVIRTDSAGNVLWQKTLTGQGILEGDSVLQIGNGSFVVAGLTKVDKNTKENFYLAELDKDMTPVPNAQVASENTPTRWEAGQAYTVSVTFLNNGTKPWTFQDKTQFSPVGGQGGDAALFGVTENQTIPIGTVIRPGQSIKFDYMMTAPAMNGTYYPEVRMVWEDHQYFGEPVNKAVKVVNGTPDTRKPTATPVAAATTNPTAKPGSVVAATDETGPTGPTAEEKKSGLPCLSSVVLPLLIVGSVTVGMYKRRNK